jgi:transcriptional regulator of acetoin/glycerol metabolism
LRSSQKAGHQTVLQQSEKETITKILQDANFNKRKAASILGMSRTTLYAKIKQYNIIMKKAT